MTRSQLSNTLECDPRIVTADPAILYMGTPVVLISSLNENGTANLAPMSSAWWLGWGCMLGLNSTSKAVSNILRTGQCVLNLPSEKQVASVDRLALTTGSNPVPANKLPMGFRFVEDKFGVAGLTPIDSEFVGAPRVRECPIQLEAELSVVHDFGVGNPRIRSPMKAVEVRIVRVHVAENILREENKNRIDPEKWRPLIMELPRVLRTRRQFASIAPQPISRRVVQASSSRRWGRLIGVGNGRFSTILSFCLPVRGEQS